MNPARGFTMMEMILTLVILSVLSTIALPQIVGAIQNFRLNSAAQKMLSDIRYARELALNRHGTYGIQVNAASNSYQIFSLVGATKTVLTDPMKRTSMIVDFDLLPQYSGVSIGAVDFCEAGGCAAVDLRFNSFGVPSDSSGAVMASAATVQLSAGGITKTVRINQQTAFSEVV
ncbi:MAG: prepilin-type N-terminal cleavage/methylation domain-containing protein [Candidatus Omnitrophica bacterium]|nr:prepilin-type N-terminal cleavage/methylation domain-containing protein [Candidatus Omnitrophota bacterium]